MTAGNIQQRLFDVIPPYPAPVTIYALYSLLPYNHRSIQQALVALREAGLVEAIAGTKFCYRRTEGAERPTDGRHGHPRAKA